MCRPARSCRRPRNEPVAFHTKRHGAAVVMLLTPDDFYKSMTTHADHTVWQDVYRPNTSVGDVYLKLTVIDDVLIVSFKEL
ncbi:MAG: type II toxin-antitoxin system MqsR family toxin [Betaproteobacteria bacterium]